jgi:hypothetical protein
MRGDHEQARGRDRIRSEWRKAVFRLRRTIFASSGTVKYSLQSALAETTTSRETHTFPRAAPDVFCSSCSMMIRSAPARSDTGVLPFAY